LIFFSIKTKPLGKAWDFQAVKNSASITLIVNQVNYDADKYPADTQKIWAQGNLDF